MSESSCAKPCEGSANECAGNAAIRTVSPKSIAERPRTEQAVAIMALAAVSATTFAVVLCLSLHAHIHILLAFSMIT